MAMRQVPPVSYPARVQRKPMGLDTFEYSAARTDAIAGGLELARRHVETAALRFREELVPRAGAHAFAATGHLRQALRLLDEAAIAFA
jgi:hypothetical protein